MKYTCLNCYKKKDIDKMRNKTVCNRCFKKVVKNSKKAKREYLQEGSKTIITFIIILTLALLWFIIIPTLALLW